MIRRLFERVGYVSTVAIVLGIGGYQGIQTDSISFDIFGLFINIVTMEAVTTTIVFSILVTVSGVMLGREIFRDRDSEERVVHGPAVAAIRSSLP
ncbi:MAG: hypothetical protein U5K37_02540 [Natrialbaceae archaeon]|nr:hypothetical protein [Natrialbaceae archaeon]